MDFIIIIIIFLNKRARAQIQYCSSNFKSMTSLLCTVHLTNLMIFSIFIQLLHQILSNHHKAFQVKFYRWVVG